MGESDDDLTRRELLKQTSATLGTLALGVGCSDSEADDKPPSSSAGNPAPGGAGTTSQQGGSGATAGRAPNATSGSGGGTAGARPAAGSSATAGTTPGNAGTPPDEAGAGAGAGQGGGGGPPSGKPSVAIVKNADNLDMTVARAVELAGGIDEIQAGQTVFIKINAVSPRAIGMPAIRTSNEVMASVIRLVKQRNPGRIIVGDRSARMFPDSASVFDAAGIVEAAMAAGADEVYPAPRPDQDPEAWMMATPNGYEATWGSRGILVMRKIVEADHLINVPACKNHAFALFSLSMKNFVGAIGDTSRDPLHYIQSSGGDFQPIGFDIALLNQAFSPLINVIDATTMLINGGPYGDGTNTVRVPAGLILASRDRVALDALGVSLIKFELGRNDVPQPDATHDTLTSTSPWMLPQIRGGIMHKLGVASHSEAELKFEGVPDAAAIEQIFRS